MAYIKRIKPFLIFITIPLITTGAYFVFSQKPAGKVVYENKAALSQIEQLQNFDADSDNDGLLDWEEALWKTNPQNPDTDGDGTKDGEEVKENRNPLVKGPDDNLLDTLYSQKNNRQNGLEQEETFTATLGKQLFSEYLVNKGINNGVLGAGAAEDIANSVMDTMEHYSQPGADVYKITDIKIVKTADPQKIKEYANLFGAIIIKYFDPLPESELAILQKAMETEDGEKLKELEPLALAYKKTAEEGLALEVPEPLAQNHLATINAFYNIAGQVENMKKFVTDPALTGVGVMQYQTSSQKAYEGLKALNDYFLKNSVVFGETETGHVFSAYL